MKLYLIQDCPEDETVTAGIALTREAAEEWINLHDSDMTILEVEINEPCVIFNELYQDYFATCVTM